MLFIAHEPESKLMNSVVTYYMWSNWRRARKSHPAKPHLWEATAKALILPGYRVQELHLRNTALLVNFSCVIPVQAHSNTSTTLLLLCYPSALIWAVSKIHNPIASRLLTNLPLLSSRAKTQTPVQPSKALGHLAVRFFSTPPRRDLVPELQWASLCPIKIMKYSSSRNLYAQSSSGLYLPPQVTVCPRRHCCADFLGAGVSTLSLPPLNMLLLSMYHVT